ncbi:hypothetical protein F7Q99_33160 [Streptomyces kaniharaensis]|uniref:Uncharacterized protein n=1 Tax=Streptomyces kaniharaensis TaxID=212423 RepID=A0A6N7L2J6_9ACTN|nr:hypothetical protein [Streptomyces kaniharaensis]MQS16909.1 hypothetical protein [Streptomyces kaniharaensis]
MSAAPPRNGAVRAAAIALVTGGLALHLWVGSKLPLLAVAAGLACHLTAAVMARRWLRSRAKQAPPA